MTTKLIKCPQGQANPAVCCANGRICPRCGAHGRGEVCQARDCDTIAAQRTTCPTCNGHGFVEKRVGGGHYRRVKCDGPCGGYSTIHGRMFGEKKP